MKKLSINIVVIVIVVFILSSIASATAVPPQVAPMRFYWMSYYGDCDGDGTTMYYDIWILNDYLTRYPNYTFGTLQPNNADDDWNTCDVDIDFALTQLDKDIIIHYLNVEPLGIPITTWVLAPADLRDTYNTINTFFPFQANVSAYDGTAGRAGFFVIAEVVPIGNGSTTTGSLSGRECDPVSPTPVNQLAAVGAQCAIGVTITNWGNDPTLGLTESGIYGLQIKADAPGVLYIDLSIEPSVLESPALSVTVPVTFGGAPNIPPAWLVEPSTITITAGSVYNQTNGTATDENSLDTLICSSGGTSCSDFTPVVSGTGVSPLNCNILFTATQPIQTCNLRVEVNDGAATIGKTIPIIIPMYSPFPTINRFSIGRLGTSTPAFYSDNTIAEVSVWNATLSSKQVKQLIYKKLTGAESGLVGYWPLDDAGFGTSVIIKDKTKNKRNLTMHNFPTFSGITLLSACDVTSEWSYYANATPPTLDTVIFKYGIASINAGVSGNPFDYGYYWKSFSFSMQDNYLYFWLYIKDQTTADKLNGKLVEPIFIYVAHAFPTDRYRWGPPFLKLKVGWNLLGGGISDFEQRGIPGDLTQITSVRFSLWPNSSIPSGDAKFDYWYYGVPNNWVGGPPIRRR